MSTYTKPALLLPNHLDDLRASGLSDLTVEQWGCYSITADQKWLMNQLGFGHIEPPALALPILSPSRNQPDLNCVVIKPDHPRTDGKGRRKKYEVRPRSQNLIHVPLACRETIGDSL